MTRGNVHSGYRETIYIGPPPPRPRNSLGLAGFLVSLIAGPLTLGLLSPLGLLLSFFGLFKRPRGFAFAGTLLGGLGTAWIALIGLSISSAAHHARHEALEQQTLASMAAANEIVVQKIAETGQLPEGIEGNKLVLHLRDGWGHELAYDRLESDYVIRSAGPDGELQTRDDVTSKHVSD